MQVRAQIDTIQGEMPLASREYKEVVKLLIRPSGCMRCARLRTSSCKRHPSHQHLHMIDTITTSGVGEMETQSINVWYLCSLFKNEYECSK